MRPSIMITCLLVLLSCNQSKTKEKEKFTQKDSSEMVSDTVKAVTTSAPGAMLPDEAMINDLLKSNGHEKWKLVTDTQARVDVANWYLDAITKGRKENPDYPLLPKVILMEMGKWIMPHW